METNSFTIKSKLTSIHPLVSGGLSMIFRTEELDSMEKGKMLAFHTREGIVTFEVDNTDITSITTEQSQIQRLRAILKKEYNMTDKSKTFEDWYIDRLENIIKLIKDNKV